MVGFRDWVISVIIMLGLLFVAEPLLWWLVGALFGKPGNDFTFPFVLMLHWLANVARVAILILAPVIAIAYLFGQFR